jgi:hypothetical protein
MNLSDVCKVQLERSSSTVGLGCAQKTLVESEAIDDN